MFTIVKNFSYKKQFKMVYSITAYPRQVRSLKRQLSVFGTKDLFIHLLVFFSKMRHCQLRIHSSTLAPESLKNVHI